MFPPHSAPSGQNVHISPVVPGGNTYVPSMHVQFFTEVAPSTQVVDLSGHSSHFSPVVEYLPRAQKAHDSATGYVPGQQRGVNFNEYGDAPSSVPSTNTRKDVEYELSLRPTMIWINTSDSPGVTWEKSVIRSSPRNTSSTDE